MPIIKSISSLRNQTRDIASLCHEQDEPVYLTTNGEGDQQVQDIAVKTIEGSSNIKSFANLQQWISEQTRKSPQEK